MSETKMVIEEMYFFC